MSNIEKLRSLRKIIFYVSERLLSASKCHITEEEAVSDIRKYLNNYDRKAYYQLEEELQRLEDLEKENKELSQIMQLSNEYIAGVERVKTDLINENKKLKKAIVWLKNTFNITLDTKLRISDEIDCIQAFPIDMESGEVIYDLLKEGLNMTKLEEKLIELGYKALSGYNGEIFFTKFPTIFTNITITTKNGKYLSSAYGTVARMIPKYNSNMQLTIDVLQKDLEELKKCTDI